jgi:hypothetical protein
MCGSEANCVEVAPHPDGKGAVPLRSSLRPGDQVPLDADEWAVFLDAVKQGEFG